MTLDTLSEDCAKVPRKTIMSFSRISKSQLYEWQKEIRERKPRAGKELDEETVRHAVQVIDHFPHFGGRKGQVFMVYHLLGLIAQHTYNMLKKIVKRLLAQEVSSRKLLGEGKSYEHEQPATINEIWSEDFGRIAVSGQLFYIALVMDVSSLYYLGGAVAGRPSENLVEEPVLQAMTRTGGHPPKRFLLSDNGRQYRSEGHENLLDMRSIVHRLIPSCRPEYNGTMEGGVKEFKHVFYALWSKREEVADKEKDVHSHVKAVVEETLFYLNRVIPRPQLGGVTPADVMAGREAEERIRLELYREHEMDKEPQPLKKPLWQTVRECLSLGKNDDQELLIKYYHFVRKPLRNITRFQLSGVGVG